MQLILGEMFFLKIPLNKENTDIIYEIDHISSFILFQLNYNIKCVCQMLLLIFLTEKY